MAETPISTTRRGLLAAFLASPVILNTVAFAAESKDAALLSAWNTRQTALATIEARGCFYSAETHSPAETKTFDLAEMEVHNTPAATTQGAITKLWVALSHTDYVRTEEERHQHDAMRRADMAEVASFARDLDFAAEGLFRAICDLTAIVEG